MKYYNMIHHASFFRDMQREREEGASLIRKLKGGRGLSKHTEGDNNADKQWATPWWQVWNATVSITDPVNTIGRRQRRRGLFFVLFFPGWVAFNAQVSLQGHLYKPGALSSEGLENKPSFPSTIRWGKSKVGSLICSGLFCCCFFGFCCLLFAGMLILNVSVSLEAPENLTAPI